MKRLFFPLVLLSTLTAELIRAPQTDFLSFEGWPSEAPLVTEITFRNFCDHVIDPGRPFFDPDLVKKGDTIYLHIWYLQWFEKNVHDLISNPYVLVTCDVGSWLPEPCLTRLLYDPKCAAWFCKNIIFSYHPKLFQLPMGQNIFSFGTFGLDYLITLSQKKCEKKHFLYMNHYPRSHGDRDKIVELFEKEPYCFSRNSKGFHEYIPRTQYLDELAASEFVISPYGLETDSVRTWEAFCVDCVPIVEHTFNDPIYEDLPVIKVHSWEEINPSFLVAKRSKFKKINKEKAFFPYWKSLIETVQSKIRDNQFPTENTLFSPKDLKDLTTLLENTNILLYKGFLSELRPFQLANETSTLICLQDPWYYLDELKKYAQNATVFENEERVLTVYNEDEFLPCDIFLDLSYYRNSLLTNFNDFRHHLQRDIADLYDKLEPENLIIGNMAEDEYVKECLERLWQEKGLTVTRKGSFWVLIKRPP